MSGEGGYRLAAVLGGVFGFAALLISIVGLARDSTDSGTEAAGDAQTVQAELGEFFIKTSARAVAADTDLTFEVRNSGSIAHDLTVEGGPQTAQLAGGQNALLRVGKVERSFVVFCSVPGHRETGMETSIEVGESDPSDHDNAAGAMSQEEMDRSYLAGIKAFPASTRGSGNQPLAPRSVDGVKVFGLTADEAEWEVEPGVLKKGMAYNGMIPGPAIRVALGDRVRIELRNQLAESTAIHFHGLIVPNDQDGVPGITQPLVLPGETFVYEFVVRNAGTHMYHSHMHAEVQVPAGLLGAFIVEGPDEPQVAHDEIMVLNDGPLGFTINGKGFPATAPIVAQRGETVRVRYMNEGLQIHPMHLHGMTQTVIAVDGSPLPQSYVQDTVLVAPGQRVDVLITASEVGTWAYHCHILNHAEREDGMFGMVTVLIVK